jgi:hypothetical protein
MALGKCSPVVKRTGFSFRALPKALPTDRQDNTGSLKHERMKVC